MVRRKYDEARQWFAEFYPDKAETFANARNAVLFDKTLTDKQRADFFRWVDSLRKKEEKGRAERLVALSEAHDMLDLAVYLVAFVAGDELFVVMSELVEPVNGDPVPLPVLNSDFAAVVGEPGNKLRAELRGDFGLETVYERWHRSGPDMKAIHRIFVWISPKPNKATIDHWTAREGLQAFKVKLGGNAE